MRAALCTSDIMMRKHRKCPRFPFVVIPSTERWLHQGLPALTTVTSRRRPLGREKFLTRTAAAWASSRKIFSWLRAPLKPPVAPIGQGDDPYAWLQHGNEREIKKYLEAENRYCESVLNPVREVEQMFFSAMAERLRGKS